ncbi:MAG: hypothetical protein JKY93_00680, partial [Gammaproteobacteria bacterium]|nr:hypothetical protein [Gammaproteobacteria bacterium]
MKQPLLKTSVDPVLKKDFASLAKSEGKSASALLREMAADRVSNAKDHGRASIVEEGVIGPRWKVVNTRLSSSEWEKAQQHIVAENMSVTGWLLSIIRAKILNKPQLREDEVRAVLDANY